MTEKVSTLRRKIQGVMFKLPGMITCAQFEDFILAYLDDELPPMQRRIFRLHLMVCRDCKRYLDDYKRAVELVDEMSGVEKTDLAEVPEDLIQAILAAKQP